MRDIVLVLAAILSVAICVQGRRIYLDDEYVQVEPRGGYGGSRGSSCIIKQRSIDVDDDDDTDKRAEGRQSISSLGSLIIPGANNDDDYEEDDEGDDDDQGDEYDEYPPFPPQQYGYPYGGMPPPPPYGWQQDSSPDETSLSLSSEPNFGGPYPGAYSGGYQEKHKYKNKRDKNKKKKGGNINCIIITKQGHKQKKKSQKLFGFIPIGRRRRSIANHIKALRSE